MAYNKVIILGNLTHDVELKQTANGTSVCSFSVAVNRISKEPGEASVDYFNVVAWQSKAEFISRYFRKGQSILVSGRLENRSWTDKNGNKRISTEIVAEEVSFTGNSGEKPTEAKNEPPMAMPQPQSQQTFPMPSAYQQGMPLPMQSPQLEELPYDDQLPF